jgi:hypothetical protein
MPVFIEEDDLVHYGILRRSGRYPWGSGKTENQRNKVFLQYIEEMESYGYSQKEVAKSFGITVKDLRLQKSISKTQLKAADIALAQRLQDKGMSPTAIAARMGLKGESSARALLKPGADDKNQQLQATVSAIKSEVDKKKMVDVGTGTEKHIEAVPGHIGVTTTEMETAISVLANRGYNVHPVYIPNQKSGYDNRILALCVPGITKLQAFLNRNDIQHITEITQDQGRKFVGIQDPIPVHPDRLMVKFREDGGDKADGVVFVRPGIKDLSLGGNNYGQVRIQVGPDKFIKGMAMIDDKFDAPKGVDLIFNTNKSRMENKLDALKDLDKDFPMYPFGTIVHQVNDENDKVSSAMNLVYDKGDWAEWSRTLSQQMLSKQSKELVKTQLDMTYERRLMEHDEIMALTNDVVRKKLLQGFSESTDSAAYHLKAASLPHQSTHVILPISNIKPTEVFAPRYDNGERVVLIRHPHAGPFEIPELTVNNRNAEGKRLIGPDSIDAIGIHHSVAEWLSGADFDGDTVNVIPNRERLVKTQPMLEELKGFDAKRAYPGYEGMKVMKNKQTEMGLISNLITDMSFGGASNAEMARAVKHSMVVIDAENHKLDHRLSYNDNNIADLKEKYQSGGASTLLSRRKGREYVPERRLRKRSEGGPVDMKTGELVYVPTNRMMKSGKYAGKPAVTRIKKLEEAKDARTLLGKSPTPIELMYADHSNKLKALANQTRLEYENTPTPKQNVSAKKTYAKEAADLDAKLSLAISNRPIERQAQRLSATMVQANRDYNPNWKDDKDKIRKVKFQALETARARLGAKNLDIEITPKEWEAIQAGAISAHKLTQILNNANMETVRKYATPKTSVLMTPTKMDRANQMLSMGFTRFDVAQQLGVSMSTLDKSMKGE